MLNALAALPARQTLLQLFPFTRCMPETRYTVAPSTFGLVLFAISQGRIVSLQLGRDAKDLVTGFKRSFPHASEAKGDPAFWEAGVEVLRAIEDVELPGEIDAPDTSRRFAQAITSLLPVRDGQPLLYAGRTVH